MSCEHDWTIRINDVNHGGTHIEFRPVSMTLKMPRSGMDFFRAKLPSEVGDMLQPYTKSGHRLGFRKIAEVRLNDQLIQKLLFVPDSVSYGENFTHIKLYDTIKAMDDGVVDKEWSSVTLQDAYNHVFDQVENDLVEGPVFSLAENTTERIVGTSSLSARVGEDSENPLTSGNQLFGDINQLQPVAGAIKRHLAGGAVEELADSQTQDLIDSYFAVNFNKVSPLKAITELNKKFSVNTWTSRNGDVYVGYPEANAVGHIAAPDDKRIWRYKDPQINHPREPVKSVIVEGSWVDEPGVGDTKDITDWFKETDQGFGDAIAIGYAERTDIANGVNFSIKNTRAKKDHLPDVAEAALRERSKKQNSGTVTIDPSLSGEQATPVESVRPGDVIVLVPPDQIFENPTATSGTQGNPPVNDDYCGSYVRNDRYVISEVRHNLTDSGDWMVSLDVGAYPDMEIDSIMKYFVPEMEKMIEADKFEEGGALQGEDINTDRYPDGPMYQGDG